MTDMGYAYGVNPRARLNPEWNLRILEESHGTKIVSAAFIGEDENQLCVVLGSGDILVLDGSDGSECRRFRHAMGQTNAVASRCGGTQLITCEWNGLIKIWDVANGAEVWSFDAGYFAPTCVADVANGKAIAIGSVEGNVYVIDPVSFEVELLHPVHPQGRAPAIVNMVVSADGGTLVVCRHDRRNLVIRVRDGVILFEYSGGGTPTFARPRLVASESLLCMIEAPTAWSHPDEWSPPDAWCDGLARVHCGKSTSVELLTDAYCSAVSNSHEYVAGMRYRPGADWIGGSFPFVRDDGAELLCLQLSSGVERTFSFPGAASITAMAISDEGTRLLAIKRSGDVVVIDLNHGDEVLSLGEGRFMRKLRSEERVNDMVAVEWLANGVAMCLQDGWVLLWRA